MSDNCLVCGLPGTPIKGVRMNADDGRLTWVDASPGAACSPECATFVLVRPKLETPDERAISSWRWRQRRAEARGEPFSEAPPMDEGERTMVLRLRQWRERYGIAWDGEQFVHVGPKPEAA